MTSYILGDALDDCIFNMKRAAMEFFFCFFCVLVKPLDAFLIGLISGDLVWSYLSLSADPFLCNNIYLYLHHCWFARNKNSENKIESDYFGWVLALYPILRVSGGELA